MALHLNYNKLENLSLALIRKMLCLEKIVEAKVLKGIVIQIQHNLCNRSMGLSELFLWGL